MKLKLLILFLSCTAVFGQRVLLVLSTNQPNIPDGWPVVVQPCGTNTTIPAGFHTNIAWDVYTAYRASLEPWMDASNAVVRAQQTLNRETKIADAVELYQRIPAGLQLAQQVATNSAIIEASLASGTNTQAQVVTRIRQLNGNVNTLNTVQSNILVYLEKIGPSLKHIYDSQLPPE